MSKEQSEQSATSALLSSLGLTRDQELDCDAFLEKIASLVDGAIKDEQVLALMEHHRIICPECEEELQILARAIGAEILSV